MIYSSNLDIISVLTINIHPHFPHGTLISPDQDSADHLGVLWGRLIGQADVDGPR